MFNVALQAPVTVGAGSEVNVCLSSQGLLLSTPNPTMQQHKPQLSPSQFFSLITSKYHFQFPDITTGKMTYSGVVLVGVFKIPN